MRAASLIFLILACSAPPAEPELDSGSGGGGATQATGGGGGDAAGGGVQAAGGGAAVVPDAGLPALTADEQAMLADRPYRVVVPDSYDGGEAVPFMLLLHGYGNSGSA